MSALRVKRRGTITFEGRFRTQDLLLFASQGASRLLIVLGLWGNLQ
jgi:hypothetical protein